MIIQHIFFSESHEALANMAEITKRCDSFWRYHGHDKNHNILRGLNIAKKTYTHEKWSDSFHIKTYCKCPPLTFSVAKLAFVALLYC